MNIKKTKMIIRPRHKCEYNKCNNISLYGYKRAIYCESHKKNDMKNFVEHKCCKCELIQIVNADNVCVYCDPKCTNSFRLAKQKEITGKKATESRAIESSSWCFNTSATS